MDVMMMNEHSIHKNTSCDSTSIHDNIHSHTRTYVGVPTRRAPAHTPVPPHPHLTHRPRVRADLLRTTQTQRIYRPQHHYLLQTVAFPEQQYNHAQEQQRTTPQRLRNFSSKGYDFQESPYSILASNSAMQKIDPEKTEFPEKTAREAHGCPALLWRHAWRRNDLYRDRPEESGVWRIKPRGTGGHATGWDVRRSHWESISIPDIPVAEPMGQVIQR